MNHNKCFTHPKVKSASECSYCKAEYCSPCLNLIGDRNEVICNNCHATLSQQFYMSMVKRKKYMYVGYIVIIISAYLTVANWGEGAGNMALLLLMFVIGLIFVTKRRIGEMKQFLNTRSFETQ